jgi:hypothetical protein
VDAAGTATPTITCNPSNCTSTTSVVLTTEQGYSNYQWYLGVSPISGATTYTYTATASGNYTVAYKAGACTNTSATKAVIISAPPEHVPYSSTPMKITAAASNNLTWDVTNCPSTNYHVIYGWGSTMGTSPTVVGGQCSLGTSGTATWTPPDPSGDSSKYLWFFVVGDDGVSKEGPWGLTTEGSSASYQCGMTVKDASGTCNTP